MIPKECERLAQVDFPIGVVSKHSAREKSIRHGHPSTLHLWWARGPLASSRPVLLGLLWPHPCDPLCPEGFKQKARELLPQVGGCNPGTTDEDLGKAGVECEYEGGWNANVSETVSFLVEKTDMGVRVRVRGTPKTEEVIPLGILKESTCRPAAWAFLRQVPKGILTVVHLGIACGIDRYPII